MSGWGWEVFAHQGVGEGLAFLLAFCVACQYEAQCHLCLHSMYIPKLCLLETEADFRASPWQFSGAVSVSHVQCYGAAITHLSIALL